MVSPFPNSVKKLWDDWNIRGFILLSLSLQTFLILCAPLRKRMSNMWVMSLIWAVYLLADWVANFAVGLIASSQGGTPQGPIDVHLLAFWAPFLLLHLGGPDTITSFSLEDNAFWLRHLLGLLFQSMATLHIILQSLDSKNKLWLPTLVLLLTGIIKYAERTRSLYLGNLYALGNPSRGYGLPNLTPKVSPRYQTGERMLRNTIAVVQCAYYFFDAFKGFMVEGSHLPTYEREKSKDFFSRRTPEEAYEVIAVELNFIYESLFTKVVAVRSKKGYFFRAISFSSLSISLFFFYKLDKHGLHRFDVGITYTLLFGAIALESIAVFMLIFSEWTVIAPEDSWQKYCIASLLQKYLNVKRSRCYSSKKTNSCSDWSRQIRFGRWCESISAFNMIDYVLREHPKFSRIRVPDHCGISYMKTIEFLGLQNLRAMIKYVSSKPLSQDMWNFIFQEFIQKKAVAAANILHSARGDWILQNNGNRYGDCSDLLQYVVNFKYDESLLMWHIATELCYNLDKSNAGIGTGRRECSKSLSDYMFYLLSMQPSMMSSVARIGHPSLQHTCEKIDELAVHERKIDKEQACKSILEEYESHREAVENDYVLFHACALVEKLKKYEEKKWDLMSQVWVELLSFAAGHCTASNHAQMLSKGGELLTFVWLLMTHIEINKQYI